MKPVGRGLRAVLPPPNGQPTARTYQDAVCADAVDGHGGDRNGNLSLVTQQGQLHLRFVGNCHLDSTQRQQHEEWGQQHEHPPHLGNETGVPLAYLDIAKGANELSVDCQQKIPLANKRSGGSSVEKLCDRKHLEHVERS